MIVAKRNHFYWIAIEGGTPTLAYHGPSGVFPEDRWWTIGNEMPVEEDETVAVLAEIVPPAGLDVSSPFT